MKSKILTLVMVILIAAAGRAEVMKITDLSLGSQGLKASDKASGKALWKSVVKTVKTANDKGEPFLMIEENGSGIYGKEAKQQSWHSAAYFWIKGDQLIPYQVKQVYKDPNGQVIGTVDKYYDQKNKQVACKINGSAKQSDFPADLVDKELLGTTLINYPLDRRQVSFHLLTHEPTLYRIDMKYLGNETMGGVECYKLQMIPDLGMLNLLGAFVPKTYFWYSLKAPHKFVRYEGLESGLGTPYIVMEAND